MRKACLMCTAALGALAFAHQANAYQITAASLNYFNFGTATSAGYQGALVNRTVNGVTFNSFNGNASAPTGLYAGSGGTNSQNGFATPFGSGLQEYLGVQANGNGNNGGSITMMFGSAQTSLGILWGTVDDYNDLTFTFTGPGGGSVTISGNDVTNAGLGNDNGSTNMSLLISGLNPFTTVVASDRTKSAFEFDLGTPVPEPVSLALLGTGLVGLGFARKRSRGLSAA